VLNMGGNLITNLATAVADIDAINFGQVKGLTNSLMGDVQNGFKMSGVLNMGGNLITNLATAVADIDAINFGQVKGLTNSLMGDIQNGFIMKGPLVVSNNYGGIIYHSGSSYYNMIYGTNISSESYLYVNRYTNGLLASKGKIWDSATDGSASGLDADLLDGHSSAYFTPAASNTSINATLAWSPGAPTKLNPLEPAYAYVYIKDSAGTAVTYPVYIKVWISNMDAQTSPTNILDLSTHASSTPLYSSTGRDMWRNGNNWVETITSTNGAAVLKVAFPESDTTNYYFNVMFDGRVYTSAAQQWTVP